MDFIKGMRDSGRGLGRCPFVRLRGQAVFWKASPCTRCTAMRCLPPEALLGSLGSCSSSITYLWQHSDAIDSNPLPPVGEQAGLIRRSICEDEGTVLTSFLHRLPSTAPSYSDFKPYSKARLAASPGHAISQRLLLKPIVPDYNMKVFTQRFLFLLLWLAPIWPVRSPYSEQ